VQAALANDGPPAYRRARPGSVVDAVEPQTRERCGRYGDAADGDRRADRLDPRDHGAAGSGGRAAPGLLAAGPGHRAPSCAAGELAESDSWSPDIELPVGFRQSRTAEQLPVLTMVSGYSRRIAADSLAGRRGPLAGWRAELGQLGGVPRLLVGDDEGAIGRHHRGESELTAECQAFRGTLATKVSVCQPADPEAKGIPCSKATAWTPRLRGRAGGRSNVLAIRRTSSDGLSPLRRLVPSVASQDAALRAPPQTARSVPPGRPRSRPVRCAPTRSGVRRPARFP
jgi:hypothetical protein